MSTQVVEVSDGSIVVTTDVGLNGATKQSVADEATARANADIALTAALALKAPLASPALTGTPTAPTAATATSTTQLATTAFVQQELAAGGSTARALVVSVRNQSGGTMAAGTVVYLNGATGNLPTIEKALATSDATSAQTIGLVQTSIADNGTGLVVVRGVLGNLNTSTLTEGQQLYLSPTTAGAYTTTKQYAPNHLVYIGVVTRAHPTLGSIEVAVQNGFELDELHNVSAQSPANGDTLRYNSTTSLWEKKALGTLAGQNGTFSGTSSGTNTGDQTATTVPNTPAGNIAATTVQAAINELDSEKASVVSLSAETARATAAEALLVSKSVSLYSYTGNQAFVFEGDSMTQGNNVGVTVPYPTAFLATPWAVSNTAAGYNVGAGGEDLTALESQYSTQVYPRRPAANGGRLATVIVWIGHNDYVGLTLAGGLSQVPAWFTRLSAYWTQAKADGFRVVALTVLRRDDAYILNTTYDAVRRDINERILSSAVPDFVVDAAAMFPNPNDTRYFTTDKVHLTDASNRILGAYLSGALESNIARPAYKNQASVYAYEDSAFLGALAVNGKLTVGASDTLGISFGTSSRLRQNPFFNQIQAITENASAYYDFQAKNIIATEEVKVSDNFAKGLNFNDVVRIRHNAAELQSVTANLEAYVDFRAKDIYANGSFIGALVGNSSTATALAAGRTINGVSFNGTANILVPGNCVTNTATLDFPSIAAAASANLTMTVTGAVVGYSVSIGLPAAPAAGIVWDAFVSAADTVTIRATNITAGAIDPASATYRATVFIP